MEGTEDRVIQVMLVDDHELIRRGFRTLLESVPGIEIAAEAANGRQAVRAATQRPDLDLILMDIRMPDIDGIEAGRQILNNRRYPPWIVMLTAYEQDDYLFKALKAGVSGFLLKNVGEAELTSAIRTVAEGNAIISPEMTKRLLANFAITPLPPENGRPHAFQHLTERELEVLHQIALGRSNQRIAAAMQLTEATIKSHVSHLLIKLEVRDRAQAAFLAYEVGLVVPGAAQRRDSK
ncbi:response regulator transcription factor [Streptomyces sp. NPDC046805]|uniref:response regulator transcription factor n=1 Tax=Streptomyces sp. NPDC046805 TaxID=3155134 RepID=UPI0033CF8AD1